MSIHSSTYRRLMAMAGAAALTAGGLGAVLATSGTAFAATGLTSAPFTIGSPTSVSNVTLSSTSNVEAATSVQYTVSFKATTAGTAGDSITISAMSAGAASSVFTPSTTAVSVVDQTSGTATSSPTYTPPTTGSTSSTATVKPGFAWSAGDVITVVLGGVTNPSTSPLSVSVATTTDTNPVNSNSLNLTAGYSPTDSANPAIPSDTGVTWTFEGAAPTAVAAGQAVTVSDAAAIAGDEGSFTTGGTYTIVDNTSGKSYVIPASDVSITNGGTGATTSTASLTLPSGASIAKGDQLTVTVTEAVNGSTSPQTFSLNTPTGTAVTGSVVLGTSVSGFSASAPGAVVGVATNVTLDFTSNVGGSTTLDVSGFTPASGGVNLLTNLTTGIQHSLTAGTTSSSGVTPLTGYTTVSGDKYELVSYGATFASSGSVSVGLYTTKDTVPATQNVSVAAASSAPQIQVTTSNSSPGALSNWTVSNVEAQTALTGGTSSDTLTLTSTGATFPNYGPDYTVTDLTTPSDSFSNPSITGGGTDSVTIELPNGLAQGDKFTVSVNGVINPGTTLNDTLDLAASSAAGTIEAATAVVTAVPTATTTYPNGALIQSGGQIDVVAGGYAFGIPSPTVFGKIRAMDKSGVVAGSFPTASAPAPGTLINPVGTSGYWVVGTNGEIYQFSSMSQFMKDGYITSQVIPVPNTGGLTAGAGAPPTAANTMANGALVQFGSTIYEYAGGIATGIATPAQLAAIQKVTGAMVVMGSGSTPTSASTSANGTLVQPLGKAGVWVSNSGTLYQFMSASQFTTDGYSFQYVLPVAMTGSYTLSSI
ncbi:MAG: beta strand repeat-containing protein [Ferrimicrobium sp.]